MSAETDRAAAALAEIAVDLFASDEKRAGRLLDIATALRQATAAEPACHIIRRADGEDIGEYSFMVVDGPDDWTVPDETHDASYDDPAEYQILACHVVLVGLGLTERAGRYESGERPSAHDARRAAAAAAVDGEAM